MSWDIIESYPKIIRVQSDPCAPIYSALIGSPFDASGRTDTIADGISVRAPVRLDDIVEAMKQVKAEASNLDSSFRHS